MCTIHSLNICSQSEWDDWATDKIWFNEESEEFLPKDQAIDQNFKQVNKYKDGRDPITPNAIEYYMSKLDWERCVDFFAERFSQSYISESGDKIIAFGYYGFEY